MSADKLLIVEDEAHIAEVVGDNLALEGYEVQICADGQEALKRVRQWRPDLVLLDVMLPGLDGFAVCAQLRSEQNSVPVLFLTARGAPDDRIRGLELGGDDFLAKPFELRELVLRVRAILKRTRWMHSPHPAGDRLVLGDCVVDFKTFQVSRQDKSTELSAKEILILRVLAERAGEVVSRTEILDRVWGYDAFPTTRTIDNFIVRLRRTIEADAQNPRYIHTVRGTGYRLTP